ncbi:DUF4249 domain-containing protein [uncultured Tenacibaculum sp.]|uniref:DUF4249 domain-containing protein n=1 Tax=uncultured Tenacibaculum sp. TaxID=174713 RepID=UPI002625F194|nr:DUF4249 domain-containing protein [uncultured Tenacibaculum sp.]
MKKHQNYFYFLIFILLIISCTQPIEIDNVTFEENIVVKAILTNEIKNHSITLSKTVQIDATENNPLENATVFITDDSGISYNFEESEPGEYISITQFAAIASKKYTLHIETAQGTKYLSTPEELPSSSEIDNLDFDIELNDNGEEVVVFKVNSILNNNNANYYRYTYDETYKLKAIYWSPKKIRVISENPFLFTTTIKDPNVDGVGFCYGNQKTKKIMITETKTLSEDRVIAFPIRTIPLDSYIIGIRYSIEINQYVLNKNAYDYYELLSKFSDPDEIFSQVQLGNIPSNIRAEVNPSNNKVSGFFEVSTVYTERFYVNREDITDTNFTNYVTSSSCLDQPNPLVEDRFGRSPLLDLLNNGYIFYIDSPTNPLDVTRPYVLIGKSCGDCSFFGQPVAPSFWID